MNSRVNLSHFSDLDSRSAIAYANRYLPAVLGLILVVVIAWQLAQTVWLLVPGPAAGSHVLMPADSAVSTVGSGTDVAAIAAAHLFGAADAEDAAPTIAPEEDEDLADTRRANLTLKGTVASGQSDFSIALISDSGDEQKVYSVGDTIDSGSSLHAVYADRVVLNENGVLTNLKLPREFISAPASSNRRTTTARQLTSNNANSIQAVVSQNLTKLTDVIRPTPYLQNGQPAGYRVYPGRDRKQFAALGLRPGDIIKDIDGQSLTDPSRAMQIFQSLGTAEQVTVTVERNGEAETLVLKTSQLDLGGEQTK